MILYNTRMCLNEIQIKWDTLELKSLAKGRTDPITQIVIDHGIQYSIQHFAY